MVVAVLVLLVVVLAAVALHRKPEVRGASAGSAAPHVLSHRDAEREATAALLLALPGVVIALVLTALWTLVMGTASFGGDESTLVRGWAGVLRNIPAYALLAAVAAASIVFAARALRHQSRRGRAALIASSFALLFALSSITRDGAEVEMTTRSATITWILFAVDVVIVTAVFLGARRWASRGR